MLVAFAAAPPEPPVATLVVAPASVTALWGTTIAPAISARDSVGRELRGVALTWSSSDSTVATVDGQGRVTLLRRGTAMIRITGGGSTATMPVTVQGFSKLATTTEDFTCALPDEPTQLYCWGYGPRLPLSQPASQQINPVAVRAGAIPAGTRIADVALSAFHGCALTEPGQLYCYGANGPVIGSADGLPHPDFTAVADGEKKAGARWTSVAASPMNTCAIAEEQELYCWGSLNAAVGLNRRTASQPVRAARGDIPSGARLTAVTTSINGGCVIASGAPYCWSSSPRSGVFGPTALTTGDRPANVTLTAIHSDDFTCALGSDGRAYCWGAAAGRRFGQGAPAFVSAPAPRLVAVGALPSGATFSSLSLGGIANVTCAVASDAATYCWGLSHNGSSGDGGTVADRDVLAPTRVTRGEMPADVQSSAVSCGKYHCTVIGTDGRIYSWGSNQFSQLARPSQAGMRYSAPLLASPPQRP